MYGDVMKDKNDLLIVEAVMRLKQLKDITRIKKEGERLFSHTNTRGRKRYIKICNSQKNAEEVSSQYKGEYFKSWGSWVCLYE